MMFGKHDVVKLLFAYNLIYFCTCLYAGEGMYICFNTMFLISLVLGYLIVMMNVLEKMNTEKFNLIDKEREITEKLKGEYQTIHKKKIQTGFLRTNKKQLFIHPPPGGNKFHLDFLKRMV